MPGFTGTSMYPKLMNASGLGYSEMISALITTALSRTNGTLGN
jgi:D-alanine-D-alanine ligase